MGMTTIKGCMCMHIYAEACAALKLGKADKQDTRLGLLHSKVAERQTWIAQT